MQSAFENIRRGNIKVQQKRAKVHSRFEHRIYPIVFDLMHAALHPQYTLQSLQMSLRFYTSPRHLFSGQLDD